MTVYCPVHLCFRQVVVAQIDTVTRAFLPSAMVAALWGGGFFCDFPRIEMSCFAMVMAFASMLPGGLAFESAANNGDNLPLHRTTDDACVS